jgi:hypothetical protein
MAGSRERLPVKLRGDVETRICGMWDFAHAGYGFRSVHLASLGESPSIDSIKGRYYAGVGRSSRPGGSKPVRLGSLSLPVKRAVLDPYPRAPVLLPSKPGYKSLLAPYVSGDMN